MKAIFNRFGIYGCALALLVFFVAVPQVAQATIPVVKTVPWDPTNPTAPHTTYPLDATHEVTIVLGATVDLLGSSDTFTYDWDFGDGTAHATGTVTDPYNVSVLHQYPPSAAGGTTWTAILRVTDSNTSQNASANFYVIQQANNLQSRVNVAIDHGLWYMHSTMWRCTNGAPAGCNTGGVYGTNGVYGGWDDYVDGPSGPYSACCGYGGYYYCGVSGANDGTLVEKLAYDCADIGYGSPSAITASNVQAFEVTGHLESGPASDPYTDDVMRGLARTMMDMNPAAVAAKNYPNVYPSCASAPTAPCNNWVFDGNSNGQVLYDTLISGSNQPFYQGGPVVDAIVASGTPNAVAKTGAAPGAGYAGSPGVNGLTYKDIVQDMVDGFAYCQYPGTTGYGGAWIYGCQGGNDNSVSQWEAIGLIAANSGFGITIPAIVHDANNEWLTYDVDATNGGFGYTQPGYYPWGPYATTPSGLVQMIMNGKGRGDTRWDKTETFYRNAFCNATSGGATVAPRSYTYGLFSFTKSMLLHSPPITLLHSATAGVADIDWYNAVGLESGGSDPCDGVAQTLIKRQGGAALVNGTPNPGNPQGGYWWGNSYSSEHWPFETSWSIIMLRKTVFFACVNNLNGRGTASGRAPARIDVTWTGITGASSYNVMRGTASGGPYTVVGNTAGLAFSDTSSLVNGHTYYYVLQPLGPTGGGLCTSNEARIVIPAQGR